MQEKADPLYSRSTCYQAPCSVEFLAIPSSLAVSTVSGRHPIQLSFWLRGRSDLPQNVRRNKSLVFILKMMLKSYTQQNRSSFRYHRRVPNEPPTRAAFPEMGSHVDDLNIQGQTTEFALNLFVGPSFTRNCCTWRMSGLMSSY